MKENKVFSNGTIHLYCGDALELYDKWESPTVIISDGPYGVKGFPGDLVSPNGLDKWYEPHVKRWSELSTPLTTLWFWNTEVGWATVHPILEKYGWSYVSCCVWDKGMSHVAGNTNTKTIRHLPVVTEVCVQYVKKPFFSVGDSTMTMKEWLRYEWGRTGIPFSKTNEACGVKRRCHKKILHKMSFVVYASGRCICEDRCLCERTWQRGRETIFFHQWNIAHIQRRMGSYAFKVLLSTWCDKCMAGSTITQWRTCQNQTESCPLEPKAACSDKANH